MIDSLTTIFFESVKSINSGGISYWGIVLSSFGGAFFVFIFVKISEFLSNSSKINQKHFEALSHLQFILNEQLDNISGNIYNINELTKQFQEANKNGTILISPNRPKEILFEGSILLDLNNSELVNELFSYKVKLKRYNSDIKSINSLIEFYLIAFQNKLLDSSIYMTNLEICIKYFGEINKANKVLLDLAKTNLSRVRTRLKKDRPINLGKINIFIKGRKTEKNFKQEVKSEKKALEKEIDEVTTKSEKFIKELGIK